MKGFEPSTSGPPDQHSNRAELHPEIWFGYGVEHSIAKIKILLKKAPK